MVTASSEIITLPNSFLGKEEVWAWFFHYLTYLFLWSVLNQSLLFSINDSGVKDKKKAFGLKPFASFKWWNGYFSWYCFLVWSPFQFIKCKRESSVQKSVKKCSAVKSQLSEWCARSALLSKTDPGSGQKHPLLLDLAKTCWHDCLKDFVSVPSGCLLYIFLVTC